VKESEMILQQRHREVGDLAAAAVSKSGEDAHDAVVTPLVILLLDFGQAPSWPVVAQGFNNQMKGCVNDPLGA